MLKRLNANELKVIATKSKNYEGYELVFKNAQTGADLYAKELPEGAYALLSAKHWAYKHGEKYWFNTLAKAKDTKYFTSGEFFKELEEQPKARKSAPAKKSPATKVAPKKASKKAEPKAQKDSKTEMLAQIGKLFSEEQLAVLVAMATSK